MINSGIHTPLSICFHLHWFIRRSYMDGSVIREPVRFISARHVSMSVCDDGARTGHVRSQAGGGSLLSPRSLALSLYGRATISCTLSLFQRQYSRLNVPVRMWRQRWPPGQLTLDARRPYYLLCSLVCPRLPCIACMGWRHPALHGTLQSKATQSRLTVDGLACAGCTCTESSLDPEKQQMKKKRKLLRFPSIPVFPTTGCCFPRA